MQQTAFSRWLYVILPDCYVGTVCILLSYQYLCSNEEFIVFFLQCIIQGDNFKIGIICLFRFKTNSWFLECASRNFCSKWKLYHWFCIIKKNSLLCFAFILHLSTAFHIISTLLNFLTASRITLVLIALRILFGLPQEEFQYCVFLSTERRLVSLEVVVFSCGVAGENRKLRGKSSKSD